jgi:hypothetical protein
MPDVYLRRVGSHNNLYLMYNLDNSPAMYFLQTLEEKARNGRVKIIKRGNDYYYENLRDRQERTFSKSINIDGFGGLPVSGLEINNVIKIERHDQIPEGAVLIQPVVALAVPAPVQVPPALVQVPPALVQVPPALVQVPPAPVVCIRPEGVEEVEVEPLMRPFYDLLNERLEGRLKIISTSYLQVDGSKYSINLPAITQYNIKTNIMDSQRISSTPLINFKPEQRNRNILKLISTSHADILTPSTELNPTQEFNKKRIETIIKFIKSNFCKPIPYDLIRNHLYICGYGEPDIARINQEVPDNLEGLNWLPIDVPNFSTNLFIYTVRIYLFDSGYVGPRLELKNINILDQFYKPTKRLVCGVEDIFKIEDGIVKVTPPGGFCEYNEANGNNQILTYNAKKELDEEADIDIDFNITQSEATQIQVVHGVTTFNLSRRFEGNCTIRLKEFNSVNLNGEEFTQNFSCVKATNKNEWNFFIPLTTLNYNRLRDNLEQRAKIFETLSDADLYNQEGVPDYEDKSNIMMKKYLKYKSKYLELKKKLGK